MTSQSSASTRKQSDFTKLLLAGYEVELIEGSTQNFHVLFHGPKGTAYEGGLWKVFVSLPEDYPFASPSIGFANKILHPNIDEPSGSVCLDVINQQWTPLYSLVNVFEVFLPQLLTYPNPSDPLNSEAAALLMTDKNRYTKKVEEYVRLHANKNVILSASTSTRTSTMLDMPEAMSSPKKSAASGSPMVVGIDSSPSVASTTLTSSFSPSSGQALSFSVSPTADAISAETFAPLCQLPASSNGADCALRKDGNPIAEGDIYWDDDDDLLEDEIDDDDHYNSIRSSVPTATNNRF